MDKIKLANLYFKLSNYYSIVNIDFIQQIKYAQEALKIRLDIYTNDHPDVVNSLNRMGTAYEGLGNAKKGLEYLEQALKMARSLYPEKHIVTAQILHNIGVAYRRFGDSKKALEYGELALEIRETIFQDPHPHIAESLSSVGVAYLDLGIFDKSFEYKEKALRMRQRLYLSANHIDIARSLSVIAWEYYILENYKQAELYARKTINMYQALYPDGHPYASYALHTLGASLFQLGNIKDALSSFYQALDIIKKFSMYKHSVTGSVYYDLGRSYLKAKDYKKALQYGEESLKLRQELYVDVKNHREIVGSLHSLGDIYLALGNKVKALEFHNEALTMSLALSLVDILTHLKEGDSR